jgi:hypothetical protein
MKADKSDEKILTTDGTDNTDRNQSLGFIRAIRVIRGQICCFVSRICG